MPTAKKAKVSKAKASPKKTSKASTKAPAKQVKHITPRSEYDKPRNLVIGGVVGLLLAYIIISRALNTGSYWEYLFGLIIIIISIRLFIRSLRLK